MELMKKGRPLSEEYIPVINWLLNDAKPGKEGLIWRNFPTAKEAWEASRRLRACLSAQVQMPSGQRFSVCRSIPANDKGVDVVVFVVTQPKGIKRLRQGGR